MAKREGYQLGQYSTVEITVFKFAHYEFKIRVLLTMYLIFATFIDAHRFLISCLIRRNATFFHHKEKDKCKKAHHRNNNYKDNR